MRTIKILIVTGIALLILPFIELRGWHFGDATNWFQSLSFISKVFVALAACCLAMCLILPIVKRQKK